MNIIIYPIFLSVFLSGNLFASDDKCNVPPVNPTVERLKNEAAAPVSVVDTGPVIQKKDLLKENSDPKEEFFSRLCCL